MREKRLIGPFKVELESVSVENYIKQAEARSNISMREYLVKFLSSALGVSLLATISIFFLQGFHLWGFDLPVEILELLGKLTIGQVVGIVAEVCCLLFKR